MNCAMRLCCTFRNSLLLTAAVRESQNIRNLSILRFRKHEKPEDIQPRSGGKNGANKIITPMVEKDESKRGMKQRYVEKEDGNGNVSSKQNSIGNERVDLLNTHYSPPDLLNIQEMVSEGLVDLQGLKQKYSKPDIEDILRSAPHTSSSNDSDSHNASQYKDGYIPKAIREMGDNPSSSNSDGEVHSQWTAQHLSSFAPDSSEPATFVRTTYGYKVGTLVYELEKIIYSGDVIPSSLVQQIDITSIDVTPNYRDINIVYRVADSEGVALNYTGDHSDNEAVYHSRVSKRVEQPISMEKLYKMRDDLQKTKRYMNKHLKLSHVLVMHKMQFYVKPLRATFAQAINIRRVPQLHFIFRL